jgi:hypothetical protein
MLKLLVRLTLLSLLTTLCASYASAQTTLYANSAGTRGIDVINGDTGAIIRTCAHNKGNGRGVVVIGTTAYYTVASAGTVWKLDIETCEDLGVAFETATSGIATIAYDGTNFWINQYDSNPPGNAAYQYSPSGELLKTIVLSKCTTYCDGVEYFNSKLISNRGDAAAPIYDVYDLDGNLLTEGFINDGQGGNTTGIAYDGTNFWVSDIFNNRLRIYNGQTGAFIQFVDITGGSTTIEDLSVDYADRPDTGGPPRPAIPTIAVPTLGEWGMILLVLSLFAFGWLAQKRRV